METLEQTIIRTALPGFSKRDCPGGFIAYVAKPEDGREALVRYCHHNTDQRIHAMMHNHVRAYLLGIN